MKILITSVGASDPIRDNHDGPLLHIARFHRPDKIILIYSEGMRDKHEMVEVALASLDNYCPELLIEEKILKDEDVPHFDRMYEQISSIINKHLNDEDEFILNLTSATPQITAAMFACNRINNINTTAVQVMTHRKRANMDHIKDPIEQLIANNVDNKANSESRLVEDKSEKFNQSLIKRNLRQLIENYDYQGAYDILALRESKGLLSQTKRRQINRWLENLTDAFKYQSFLEINLDTQLSDSGYKALNNFLLIDIMNKKDLVVDVLIKAKTLTEFILENYILEKYPDLIYHDYQHPKLNFEHPNSETVFQYISEAFQKDQGEKYDPNKPYRQDATLNLHSFINIINCLEPGNLITEKAKVVSGFNDLRNRVAHGLVEIDRKRVSSRQRQTLITNLRDLLSLCYPIDEQAFQYFDEKNRQILALLT